MKILFAAFFLLALGASASAQNPIVGENQLPGTPQSTWDLSAPGSATIQGFTTDISVNHGSPVFFKVKTNTNHWKIDIYRLGYYQGNGARLITTINMTSAQSQPAPLHDAATGLNDAGNWAVSTSWTVPASAVSGVYIAKLTDLNNTNNQNHIPFIVRADESHSDIVFQTSDPTWQAYNGWDGNNCAVTRGTNLYGGNGPGGDSAPGRAYKVSYNRPIATRDGCGTFADTQDFLFSAEFSAIFWLEQNGYDVSYIAGVDTARSPALLRNHKLFTSTGHDEYWSGDQRASVEAARAAGVNLAFMSGNEVYWKTRWEPSIDGSATPNRTLVCYKETRAEGHIDPADVSPTWTWTGTWRDLRYSPPSDGARPENALTGTIFTVDSYRSDAITVPYPMTLLRFWRNTNVAATASGQTATLTQNILGYEWDESPDNGVAPAGLIDLSSTTLSVGTFLLDYGETTGNANAFHNLTLYKDPTSGAIVFGAGTVFWAWGLGPNDDGPPTPTDPNIQQAMVNLLADMGIQPATLQAGLVAGVKSTDTTPPVSGISAPANGATFTTGQPVTISGFASDIGGRVSGVEVSLDGGATWHRASGTTSWTYGWTPASAGNYTIKSRATDDSVNTETPSAGNGITVTPFGSSLFLASNGPSLINAQDPQSVELGVKFSSSVAGSITGLRFYKDPIDFGLPSLPAHTVHLWSSSGTLLATATFTGETVSGWQQVNLSTPVAITANTTYIASYHSNGMYSANANYFATAQTNGSLTAPDSASSGGNGVYAYGSAISFPSNTSSASNYWVDVVFAVPPATPVITSPLTATGTASTPFSYTITASNNPTSFNATGLPAGLSVNTATGVISGTPTAAGTSSVTLSATNAAGTGSATLSLTINTAAPPVITSASTASGTVGSPFSYTITASNNPTSFNATNLPTWASVNTTTGVISGTPTAAGTSSVALSATNAIGTGSATLSLAINTAAPSVITSPLTASGPVGSPFSYTITASNNPTSFNATGLPAGLSVNTTTGVISGTPTAAGTSSVTVSATNAGGTGSATLTLTIGVTLFLASDVPAVVNVNDTNSVELGVKFTASTAGNIAGFRFYKGSLDTGTHAAHLWSSSGTLLASATFAGETASGWQTVSIASFAITAGTTYIASYHSAGHYSANSNYFATAHVNGPLTAPDSASSGGNGVYTYGSTVSFPSNAFNATNYWVDIVFAATPATPAITSALTASGTVGSPFSYTITASNNPTSFNATGLPAGLSVNTATGVISGTPTAAGTSSVTLSATNAAGTGSATLSLTINAPATPAITSALTASGPVGSPFSYTITASNNPTGFNATGLPAGLSVNTATGVISGTPTATGTSSVTLSATNAAGTGSATLSLTIGVTLFLASDVPAVVNVNDTNSVELGVKFTSSNSGNIAGFRFYKGSQDTGTHTAHLWSATGTLLASATFAGETASGWQQVNLPTLVAIAANTTYIASYHSAGHYSVNSNYFATAHVNGPLTAPDSASSGGNGVYSYGSTASFPSNTSNATNYWVDIVFAATPGTPAINSALTASGTVGAPFSYTITASNNPTSFNATGAPAGLSVNTTTGVISGTPTAAGTSSVTVSATNAAGTGSSTLSLTINAAPPAITSALTASGPVGAPFSYTITASNNPTSFNATGLPAGLSVNTTTGVISGTPSASGTSSVTLSATNAAGTGSATLSLTIGVTLFLASDVPAVVNVNDTNSIELGVKFTASTAGNIAGFRFYKGSLDTGTHTAHLWSASGTLLASATFAGETASGWQTVSIAPFAITAGTTYVASYHTSGHYSADGNYFATAHTNGPLTAPSSASSGGNGVYAYGSAVSFPSNTYNATNYWVDVVFQ